MLGGFFVNSAFAQQNTQRADDTPLKLTLHDALQIALSDNPTVRVAEQEVKKTTYAKNKAWAALFPKVDLNGNYSYTIKKQKMYFGGMKFPGMGGSPGGNGGNNDQNSSANNAIAIEVGVRHSIQTGIQAGMPLIAPQLWSSLSINAAEVELAKEKSRGSKVDMTAEVRKAYYTALLANEAYRVYRQSYDNAQENYRQIKEKYERGLVAQYDLLRTEVQMKNIEPNVVQAELSIKLAEKQLKLLMDVDLEKPVELTDSLAVYSRQIYQDYMQPVDTLLVENSTLKQIELQGKQMAAVVQTSKMAFLPTLSLGFVYNYNYMGDELKLSNDKQWSPYSMVNLTLSIPIFNGGARLNDVKMQKAGQRQLELNRHLITRQMKLAVQNQHDQLTNATKRYIAAKEAVVSAEKGYQIAEMRYKTGESTLVELNDADLALLQARLNYNQAIYDFMMAKADLDKLSGYVATSDNVE